MYCIPYNENNYVVKISNGGIINVVNFRLTKVLALFKWLALINTLMLLCSVGFDYKSRSYHNDIANYNRLIILRKFVPRCKGGTVGVVAKR